MCGTDTVQRRGRGLCVRLSHTSCTDMCSKHHFTSGGVCSCPAPGMGHVVQHCSELVDEQVLKRVLVSVNSTVAILGRSAGREAGCVGGRRGVWAGGGVCGQEAGCVGGREVGCVGVRLGVGGWEAGCVGGRWGVWAGGWV